VGFTMLQSLQQVPGKTAEQVNREAAEQATAKQKRLYEQHVRYLEKRAMVRRGAIRNRMPTIVNFILMRYAVDLVALLDAAAPHIPDRLLIRVETEDAGQTVLLDQSHTIRHQALKKITDSLETEIKKLNDQIKKSPDDDGLQMALVDYIKQFVIYRDCQTELAKVDPSTEILIVIVDQGKWNDKGIPIEQRVKIAVPYEKLRLMAQRIQEDMAKEQADQAATTAATPPEVKEALEALPAPK